MIDLGFFFHKRRTSLGAHFHVVVVGVVFLSFCTQKGSTFIRKVEITCGLFLQAKKTRTFSTCRKFYLLVLLSQFKSKLSSLSTQTLCFCRTFGYYLLMIITVITVDGQRTKTISYCFLNKWENGMWRINASARNSTKYLWRAIIISWIRVVLRRRIFHVTTGINPAWNPAKIALPLTKANDRFGREIELKP